MRTRIGTLLQVSPVTTSACGGYVHKGTSPHLEVLSGTSRCQLPPRGASYYLEVPVYTSRFGVAPRGANYHLEVLVTTSRYSYYVPLDVSAYTKVSRAQSLHRDTSHL